MTTEGDQGNTNRKKIVKVLLIADDMIIHLSDPKNSTRKLLQLVNTFSKVTGYNINLKTKYQQHSYINNKWTEKEIREITSFTILSNNIKYLGVSVTKQVKDLYDKNFKSLKKES